MNDKFKNETIKITTAHGSSEVIFTSIESIDFPKKNTFWICDSNTEKFVNKIEPKGQKYTIVPGEKFKTFDTVVDIIKQALKKDLNKDTTFIAVGGGVVCDITGFVASIFKRGAKCFLIPTTLLAQVDASIGGKNGINFQEVKNCLGTITLPSKVYISDYFLEYLPKQEIKNGVAEIFKIAILFSPELYELIKDMDSNSWKNPCNLKEIIYKAIKTKAEIVESDFFDNDKRSALNFGHTFGHALESVLDFIDISHGEAVAWGIACALNYGVEVGITDRKYRDIIIDWLNKNDFQTSPYHEKSRKYLLDHEFYDMITKRMLHDKKRKTKNIKLILQDKQFSYIEHLTSLEELKNILEKIG